MSTKFWRGEYDRYLYAILNYRVVGIPDKIAMDKLREFQSMSDEEFDQYFLISKWRKKFSLDGYTFTYWRNKAERLLTEWAWKKSLKFGG